MRTIWSSLRRHLAHERTVLILLFGAYVISGLLGLMGVFGYEFAYVHRAASVVFPPAGIALGAFLVFGYRMWLPILLGGIVIYGVVLGPTPAVIALSAGNTLEGLLTAYLINRYASGRGALQSPANSMRFAGLIVLSGFTVGATIGTLTLLVVGEVTFDQVPMLWFTWALGNVAGCLVFGAAVVLGTQVSSTRWRARRIAEGAAVYTCVVIVCLVAFWDIPAQLRGFPVEYLCIPVLLWSAFRLGRRPTALALVLLNLLTIAGTLMGFGPFTFTAPVSLIVVQLFMVVTSVMTLTLTALASEYVIAEAQLRELVVTDPLTGLPNYRRLVEVLEAEIQRSNRTDEPFAVVFFDMDGLKRINDELGHLIGSRAVCRFAETLRASCRTTDTAARYGGDEFVALLPDTDDEGARVVTRRVMERLAEDPDKPQLSASAGVATYPRDGGTPTTLLSAADRALYAVKAQKAVARKRGVVPIREWTNAG